MSQERWLAIINPRAGGRRSIANRVMQQAQRHSARVSVTEHAGHALELAAGAHGYTGILVVGGDGTVFEVLQGMDRASQSLTVLPAGRGNSLARDLGPVLQQIDLMEVVFQDERGVSRRVLSASTVAVGYPVLVAETATRRLRFLRGASYPVAAALTRPRSFGANLTYDSGSPFHTTLTGFLANNTRYIASFLAVARANCSDGVLETVALRNGFFGQSVHNLAALMRSSYEPVRPIAAHRVRTSFEQPLTLLVDGELYARVVSVDVQVLPAAVTCRRLQ